MTTQEPPPHTLPPGIPAPAIRALTSAGYTRLDQLTAVSERQLTAMHGVGPKAVRIVRAALAEAGQSLAEDG
jgi:DNA integrity scanning protein DisA with diadenylate cyclase activity